MFPVLHAEIVFVFNAGMGGGHEFVSNNICIINLKESLDGLQNLAQNKWLHKRPSRIGTLAF